MSGFPLTRALERFQLPWERLAWPLDWETHFGRGGPVRLELGFGNGEYLEARAGGEPDALWVGVEISWVSIVRVVKRLERRGLDSVRVLQGDGLTILSRGVARGSLDELVLNHPDPWPKVRHHPRRVVRDETIGLLADCLRPGGRLTIATDHAGYAEWIEGVLGRQERLRSCYRTPWVSELPGRFRTKYERKGREQGSTIHFFVWERDDGPITVPLPVEENDAMPNVLLQGRLRGESPLPDFRPMQWEGRHGEVAVRIRFLTAYGKQTGDGWMVETRVQEDGFIQHMGLVLTPRPGHVLVIKCGSLGFPRPTWGVKSAIRLLAGMTLRAQPGLLVHTSSVGAPDTAGLVDDPGGSTQTEDP